MSLFVGVNTAMFDGLDPDIAFSTIKKAGFNAVELAYNQGYVGNLSASLFTRSNADKINALLDKHRLTTQTLGATMNMAAPDTLEAFGQRIAFAGMIGARFITFCLGRMADKDIIISHLKQLAPVAAAHHCTLCIENGGDPNYDVFARARDGFDLLAAVNHPAVAFNIDAGNSVSLCPDDDAIDQACAMIPGAAHCHIKDVTVSDNGYDFPAIGTGMLNYPRLLDKLAQNRIPCSLEIPLRMHRQPDSFPQRAAQPIDPQVSLDVLITSRRALANWLD